MATLALCCVRDTEMWAMWARCASRVGISEVRTWVLHKWNYYWTLLHLNFVCGVVEIIRHAFLHHHYAMLIVFIKQATRTTKGDPVSHHFSLLKHLMMFFFCVWHRHWKNLPKDCLSRLNWAMDVCDGTLSVWNLSHTAFTKCMNSRNWKKIKVCVMLVVPTAHPEQCWHLGAKASI
jgi:hypothetical protein